jgi:hypothetical protein
MSRLYLLRCTPDGLAARKAFSSERVRVLSAIIEDGAQFRDTRARRRLGPELRWWAYCWIGERDAALPYPERKQVHLRRRDLSEREKRGVAPGPLPREIRDVLRALFNATEKATTAVGDVDRTLAALDGAAYGALRPFLPWPHGRSKGQTLAVPEHLEGALAEAVSDRVRGNELRRAWLGELERMHRQLAWFSRAVNSSLGTIKGSDGPKPRELHRAAIYDLGRLWLGLTGCRPVREVEAGSRSGPFREFVYAAMKPIWPRMPSVDGLIDEVCSQLASELD